MSLLRVPAVARAAKGARALPLMSPGPGFARPSSFTSREGTGTLRGCHRGGVPPHAALLPQGAGGQPWGAHLRAPSTAGRMAARVSALRELTRGRGPNAANAVSEVSSAAGQATEERRGVRPEAGPPDLCAPGLPASALPPRPSHANANISNIRSGSKTAHQHLSKGQP